MPSKERCDYVITRRKNKGKQCTKRLGHCRGHRSRDQRKFPGKCEKGLHDRPEGHKGKCPGCRSAYSRAWNRAYKKESIEAGLCGAGDGKPIAATSTTMCQDCLDRRSEKRRDQADARAREQARTASPSFLNGCYRPKLTRIEKLRLMAEQDVSPLEAAIARQKLEKYSDFDFAAR